MSFMFSLVSQIHLLSQSFVPIHWSIVITVQVVDVAARKKLLKCKAKFDHETQKMVTKTAVCSLLTTLKAINIHCLPKNTFPEGHARLWAMRRHEAGRLSNQWTLALVDDEHVNTTMTILYTIKFICPLFCVTQFGPDCIPRPPLFRINCISTKAIFLLGFTRNTSHLTTIVTNCMSWK